VRVALGDVYGIDGRGVYCDEPCWKLRLTDDTIRRMPDPDHIPAMAVLDLLAEDSGEDSNASDIPHGNAKVYKWGDRLVTMAQVTAETGIRAETLRGHINRGLSIDNAIAEIRSRRVFYEGKWWPKTTLARHLGTDPKRFAERIGRGWSVDKAMDDIEQDGAATRLERGKRNFAGTTRTALHHHRKKN
jgi:hypothetical protein